MNGALERINRAEQHEAESMFRDCCGSTRWASLMTEARPFTSEDQRGLTKLPASATWALEKDGRLVRQQDGVAAVEKSECRVMTRAVKDPKTSQPTAQVGDLLLTEESSNDRPAARRLLRRIGSAQ